MAVSVDDSAYVCDLRLYQQEISAAAEAGWEQASSSEIPLALVLALALAHSSCSYAYP